MDKTSALSKNRELTSESGHSVKLSLSEQIIHLDRLSNSSSLNKIYKSPRKASEFSPPINGFISAGTLIYKAKLFDDGLMASIEKILQNGLGPFMGKRAFLKKLAEDLLDQFPEPPEDGSNKAVGIVLAACRLGGISLDNEKVLKNWNEYLNQFLTEFEINPVLSRPTSYYTFDEELKKIFKQDRILQTPLKLLEDLKSAQSVADTIKADPALFNTYLTYLEIIAKISNPLRIPDLRILFGDISDDNIKFDIEVAAIVPPIVSHEEELLAKIIGPGNPVPEKFSLLDEFIKFIKARKVSLRPTSDSGWYDYTTWSLAPLVSLTSMVESKHLEFDDSYCLLLEELFRGKVNPLLEQVQEAQKQPEIESSSTPPRIQVQIEPVLHVEPLPTFYYRRGFSYRFIKNVLLTIFDEDQLHSLKRSSINGEAKEDLFTELEFMENLFFGAHRQTCTDLGMDPAQTPEESLAVFNGWASHYLTDIDLNQENRVMIPIAYDVEKRQTKVYCFCGWRLEELEISFAKPPEVEIFSKSGKKMARKDLWLRPTYVGNSGQTADEISYSFTSVKVKALYPVIEELTLDKTLEKKQFQDICDSNEKFEALVSSIENRQTV